MRRLGTALVLATGVSLALIAYCSGQTEREEEPDEPRTQGWRTMPTEVLPKEEAVAVQAVCQRFFDLLQAEQKDAAYALLDPADQATPFYDPRVRQVQTVETLRIALASSTVVQVQAAVVYVRSLEGPTKGQRSRYVNQFFFERDDPQHVIHLPRGQYRDLPVLSVQRFVPWWTDTPLTDELLEKERARTCGLMSPLWEGWDEDPQRTWQHIVDWWISQEAKHGHWDGGKTLSELAAFSGLDGDAAIVDRVVWFTGDTHSARVTYRFRLLPEVADAKVSGDAAGPKWRIQDVCEYEVQEQ